MLFALLGRRLVLASAVCGAVCGALATARSSTVPRTTAWAADAGAAKRKKRHRVVVAQPDDGAEDASVSLEASRETWLAQADVSSVSVDGDGRTQLVFSCTVDGAGDKQLVVSVENHSLLTRKIAFVALGDGAVHCEASSRAVGVLVCPGERVEVMRLTVLADEFTLPALKAWVTAADVRVCDDDAQMCMAINAVSPTRSLVRVENKRLEDLTWTWSFSTENGRFVDNDGLPVNAPYVVVIPGAHNDTNSQFSKRAPFVVGAFEQQDVDKPFSFRWHFDALRSNVFAEHADVQYVLPFRIAEGAPPVHVSQVAGGTFSHQASNAVDFGLAENSEVLSMRAGVVTKVVMDNWLSKFAPGVCPQPVTLTCATPGSDANEIHILHDDGTFGTYAHLAANSAVVKVGDRVVAGQPIAKSGNTGFSTAPHLHVDVSVRKGGDGSANVSVPILFHDPAVPLLPRADEVPDDCLVLIDRLGRPYYSCLSTGNVPTYTRPRRNTTDNPPPGDAANGRVVTWTQTKLRNEVVVPSAGAMFARLGQRWNTSNSNSNQQDSEER
jgi:murein DD-endopeptidase MepM/ murein hydrolase activator NlpD